MSRQEGPIVAAVDVGGTTTKAALVSPGGTATAARVRATPAPGPHVAAGVVGLVGELVEELRAEAAGEVAAVGVVAPGIVDDERGVAVWSENLRWRDVPLREQVAARTALPTVVGHDVRAGGLAEQRLGAAREVADAVFLPIGTGIAAALVLDGAVYSAGGFAGEIGHVPMGGSGPCGCGGTGCLEAVASAAAIVRRYRDRTGREVTGAAEVAGRAGRGDADAAAVWDEAVDALATALVWLAGVLAPEVVVVGGGLAESGDALLAPLRRRVGARSTFHRRPRIVRALLGDRAGCLGAGLLAHDRLAATGGAWSAP